MGEKKEEMIYRKASNISMIFGVASNGMTMCFYVLMMYAGYIAAEGYGIALVVSGIIITASRLFDGVTDPIIAILFDRLKTGKHGKLRLFFLTAWAVQAVADILMFSWMPGKVSGFAAIVIFTVLYMIHIIGYTMNGIAGFTAQAALTNDPMQRPFLQTVGVAYSYLIPMALTTIMSFAVLPRYGNRYDVACLREACFWYIGIGLVLIILCCIAVTPIDNEKVLSGIEVGKKENKIGWKDVWSLIKNNKPLRMYVITGASDKLAQQTASVSIVSTLMSGVLIGSFKATTAIGNTGMIVAIVFAVIGGIWIGKVGAKKATSLGSIAAIVLAVATILFCVVLGPDGMPKIGVPGLVMSIYIVITILTNGVKMVLSTAAGTMRSDVIDYELERSGNYMPGFVSGVYNVFDKFTSSISTLLASVCVGFIGYTTTAPQMGDPVTIPLFCMTLFLMFGLPAIGWLCNIFAMKGYELDKERMAQVQVNIAERKEAAKAQAEQA